MQNKPIKERYINIYKSTLKYNIKGSINFIGCFFLIRDINCEVGLVQKVPISSQHHILDQSHCRVLKVAEVKKTEKVLCFDFECRENEGVSEK